MCAGDAGTHASGRKYVLVSHCRVNSYFIPVRLHKYTTSSVPSITYQVADTGSSECQVMQKAMQSNKTAVPGMWKRTCSHDMHLGRYQVSCIFYSRQ